jgi:hypothetical protein
MNAPTPEELAWLNDAMDAFETWLGALITYRIKPVHGDDALPEPSTERRLVDARMELMGAIINAADD